MNNMLCMLKDNAKKVRTNQQACFSIPILSQAEAEGVGEAEAEGEEEATPVKKISVIIVKIMDTGNGIAERNNVTRDTIEDSSKVLIHLNND